MTTNQKPDLLPAQVLQPIRDTPAEAFLRSQPLSLNEKWGAPSNWLLWGKEQEVSKPLGKGRGEDEEDIQLGVQGWMGWGQCVKWQEGGSTGNVGRPFGGGLI